jgi:hypothetical protein
VLLGAVLALFLADTAVAEVRHLLNHTAHRLGDEGGTYVSAVRWPRSGQAAFVLGNGRPLAIPREQPVPIASLAKVMTAYLTLERFPLSGAQDGFTITVTAAQAQAETQDAARDESARWPRTGRRQPGPPAATRYGPRPDTELT